MAYATGRGGRSCLLQAGSVIEKGAVQFSHIYGQALPPAATKRHPNLKGSNFEAMGVSVILHPQNPYVPTAHMNVRFFQAQPLNDQPVWWFGGGFDLTPYYPFLEDCQYWHQMAYQACEPFGLEIYPQFKQNCDEYFYLTHRQESRGIGGLFFDDWHCWPFERCFELMQSIGDNFLAAYETILKRRKDTAFGERERAFQMYRRGRYVEFNLLYDRGTLFGLQSGGRVESILASLPPVVTWPVVWPSEAGSPEEQLKGYLSPRQWL